MKTSGSCLCGKVKFLINKDIHTMYHCHCSLCRKQSGTGANSATLVSETLFEWVSGINFIGTFKKDSGFTSCFCISCGSPVPNNVGNSPFIWIPLGLLNEMPVIKRRLGFCLNSKSNWAPIVQVDKEYSDKWQNSRYRWHRQ